MTKKRGPKAKVTINTRVKENPGEFRVDTMEFYFVRKIFFFI